MRICQIAIAVTIFSMISIGCKKIPQNSSAAQGKCDGQLGQIESCKLEKNLENQDAIILNLCTVYESGESHHSSHEWEPEEREGKCPKLRVKCKEGFLDLSESGSYEFPTRTSDKEVPNYMGSQAHCEKVRDQIIASAKNQGIEVEL